MPVRWLLRAPWRTQVRELAPRAGGMEAALSPAGNTMGTTKLSNHDVRHYFEYSASGVEVLQDGLQEVRFGEFLIAERVLDRQQLFRAMQMQDRNPGVRLGECAAAL